jgi:hypothetical protein
MYERNFHPIEGRSVSSLIHVSLPESRLRARQRAAWPGAVGSARPAAGWRTRSGIRNQDAHPIKDTRSELIDPIETSNVAAVLKTLAGGVSCESIVAATRAIGDAPQEGRILGAGSTHTRNDGQPVLYRIEDRMS